MGDDYTEDTLSDKENNVETCDPGCGEATRYKCTDGYKYDSANKKCVEKQTCATWSLTKKSDCGSDSTFTQSTEHPTDDYDNECGTCKKKAEECTYTYKWLDASDAHDTYIESGSDYRCKNPSACYTGISSNPSVLLSRTGTPSVMPIYNKISNTSKSCKRDGKTYYETICQGIPEEKCSGGTFTPNGCVSEGYQQYESQGFIITGTRWGSCSYCKASEGKYDTTEECIKNNPNKKCWTYTGNCAQTCESLGFYSTEELCEQGKGSLETCGSHGPCYRRNQEGFTIQYVSDLNRYWTCSYNGPVSNYSYSAYLMNVKFNSKTNKYEASGSTVYDVYDEARAYTAGMYFVCITAGNPRAPTVSVDRIFVKGTRGQGGEPYTAMCFSDNPHTYNGIECVKSAEVYTNTSCKEFTFEDGKQYYIDMRFSTSSNSSGVKCYQ